MSTDSESSQKKFRDAQRFPFPSLPTMTRPSRLPLESRDSSEWRAALHSSSRMANVSGWIPKAPPPIQAEQVLKFLQAQKP